MNFLRKLVSRTRKRYIDKDFNLDLTYITPRILAMSYPASGMEAMYRNNIDDVARFLKKHHGDNYYIINVSSRLYDYSKFGNRVLQIVWPNHHPAQFILFCQIVLETAKILLTKGDQSVVVVHCLGGKGRTGSVINCVLWMSKLFNSVEHANTYYLSKRHVNVTYPSQIDYMRLFAKFMEHGLKMLDFRRKRLARVKMRTSDWFFLDERIFKLKIFDYAKEKKILYERCFGIEVSTNNVENVKRHKTQSGKPNSSTPRLTLRKRHVAAASAQLRLRSGRRPFRDQRGPRQLGAQEGRLGGTQPARPQRRRRLQGQRRGAREAAQKGGRAEEDAKEPRNGRETGQKR